MTSLKQLVPRLAPDYQDKLQYIQECVFAERSENIEADTNPVNSKHHALQQRLLASGFSTGALASRPLIDDERHQRKLLLEQMAVRSQLRSEVFKKLADAVIQEKLAQKQHARDLELLAARPKQKSAEQYFSDLCAYLSQLLDTAKPQEAEEEIDRLFEEWRVNNS